MKEIKSLLNRNIKKYFRDKGVLIFSFLSVFIVTALYMFFLTKMQVEHVIESIGDIDGIATMINTWVIGGLVCIPAVSVPLIILCFKVDDVVAGTQYDLNVTPAKRIYIMAGYVLSAIIVGFVMSLLCLLAGEIFIVAKGGAAMAFADTISVILALLLINISFTGFEFFIILFMKTNSSVSVANSILNVLLGFLLGLYVPVGMLGETTGNVIKSFPLMQGAAIIRQKIMGDSIEKVFAGAPIDAVSEMKSFYGIDIVIDGKSMSIAFMIAILAAFGIIFYIGSLAVFKFKKEK